MSIPEAFDEARRCLNCQEPPCQMGCPSQVDSRLFNHAIAQGNLYAAAKILFTCNPLGWTCGTICPTHHFCRGTCVLSDTRHGGIHINELHTIASEALMHLHLPQIRNPAIVQEKYHHAKIALIGGGPASLSCATFLGRIGYDDITIFERLPYSGGTPAAEIPEFRMPYYITRFEIKLVEDLGVKFVYNKEYGKDMTIESLKKDGYEAIFLGIGQPKATSVKILDGLENIPNIWGYKEFLNTVACASKDGLTEKKTELPNLKGRVVVLGAGDVAADCCQTAFRCGADFVSLVFRRGIIDMRMNEDEAQGLKREKVEQIGCHSPKKVIIKDGKAIGVLCDIMRKIPGTEKYESDEGQECTIYFDHMIVAFGSQLGDNIYQPCKVTDRGVIDINPETNQCTDVEGVYAGGNCVGGATVVEAVNDGKNAAWNMHRYLAKKISNVEIPAQPSELPPFMTAIDLVDLSVEVAGMKFLNPFGLASGPSTESAVMIRRAFQNGYGFVVTKTYQRDEDILDNVCPRICGFSHSNTFVNIELNSERKVGYWEKELKKLKQEFPKNIIIASIHSKGDVASWVDLAKRTADTGVDGIQLNISCPNLGEKSQKPYTEIIKEIVSAVHAGVKIPLFPKLGHFQGDIVELAKAAKEAGAAGIVGINTIAGIYSISAEGEFSPQVGEGENGHTAYAGLSGKPVKPFALMGLAQVSQALPGFPFLACGGAENSLTAFEFLQLGAPVVQFCSASMFKGQQLLLSELIPGLKFLLYARSHKEFKGYHGFVAPGLIERSKRRPFGPYIRAIDAKQMEDIKKQELPVESKPLKEIFDHSLDIDQSQKTYTVKDMCGSALKKIVPFADLDTKVKVVSHIDTTLCLNCGKCQIACADAGYSCIFFDKTLRIPKVSPMCHGCGLCATVCSAHCITMVPKPAAKPAAAKVAAAKVAAAKAPAAKAPAGAAKK